MKNSKRIWRNAWIGFGIFIAGGALHSLSLRVLSNYMDRTTAAMSIGVAQTFISIFLIHYYFWLSIKYIEVLSKPWRLVGLVVCVCAVGMFWIQFIIHFVPWLYDDSHTVSKTGMTLLLWTLVAYFSTFFEVIGGVVPGLKRAEAI